MMQSDEDVLAQAERHVREGEERVARQEALVAQLARDGHDTAAAEGILATFRATLAEMRDHLQERRRQHGLHRDK